jgi:hypothetical protein
MLYKILIVLGIAYLVRLIFRNWSYQGQLKNQQKPQSEKDDGNTVDAEYTVIDDE